MQARCASVALGMATVMVLAGVSALDTASAASLESSKPDDCPIFAILIRPTEVVKNCTQPLDSPVVYSQR